MKRTSELSVIVKTYDLALWLLPHTARFSRDHRFSLGNRIEEGILEILELLVEASYVRDKQELLNKANVRLGRLRYLIRLAKDMKQISMNQYEFAVRGMHEIGAEIGGWAKSTSRDGP